MYKDNRFVLREYDIRFARKIFTVDAEPKT